MGDIGRTSAHYEVLPIGRTIPQPEPVPVPDPEPTPDPFPDPPAGD
jgi:hypothetical protein